MASVEVKVFIDTESGEIRYYDLNGNAVKAFVEKAKAAKAKAAAKSKESTPKPTESDVPELTLQESKFTLNNAAKTLLGLADGDRVGIQYRVRSGNDVVPVIASAKVWGETGCNKITKAGTVAFRGEQNAKLAKYGDTFTFVKSDSDFFYLIGNNAPAVEVVEDANIEVPDDDDSIIKSLESLNEPTGDDIVEIQANDLLDELGL